MHKIDGAGHVNNLFVAEDSQLFQPPTEITPAWLNAIQTELVSIIQWAGLALNKADNTQLLQALQAKFASIAPGADYATKSAVQLDDYKVADADVAGTANAIIGEFFPDIADLAGAHGMTLYVRCLAANTSTTPTFTPNNGVIAGKTIVKGNNVPLVAGDIAGAGFWAALRYDAVLDKWVLENPATGINPLAFASNPEAAGLTLGNKILSPATLAHALSIRVGHSYSASGDWLPLPGGPILQWITDSAWPINTPTSQKSYTWPTAFPNACAFAVPIAIDATTNNALTVYPLSVDRFGAVIFAQEWAAVGQNAILKLIGFGF